MNIKNTPVSDRHTSGFTIVELLIVIVVIGILAAITYVSYTGITTNANNNSAQLAASQIAKKIEVYNADVGSYPEATTSLSGDATKTYYVPAATFGTLAAKPTTPGIVKFLKCGTTPNTTQANLTAAAGNITGIRVHYWSYSANNANSEITAGADSGTGVACPAS